MNNTDRNWRDDERLKAQAKAHAAVLRRAAIDDFWRCVGSAARRALHGVARLCRLHGVARIGPNRR